MTTQNAFADTMLIDGMSEVFAQCLKRARERSGLSQEELATRSGVSRSTIAGLEANAKDPRFTTVLRLARTLGVSTDSLGAYTPDRNVYDEILSLRREQAEDRERVAAQLASLKEFLVHLSGAFTSAVRGSNETADRTDAVAGDVHLIMREQLEVRQLLLQVSKQLETTLPLRDAAPASVSSARPKKK